jgi:hypothetical protein
VDVPAKRTGSVVTQGSVESGEFGRKR